MVFSRVERKSFSLSNNNVENTLLKICLRFSFSFFPNLSDIPAIYTQLPFGALSFRQGEQYLGLLVIEGRHQFYYLSNVLV